MAAFQLGRARKLTYRVETSPLGGLKKLGFLAGTTTLGFSGGTLTVSDGTNTDSFALLGTYTVTGFQLASDGHGGTEVSYS